jgi:carbonic anhydrase
MNELKDLLENNKKWVAEMNVRYPGFFQRLSRQQSPKFLWIGCADSRVPANQIVGLLPGELFVHRNVSNVVSPGDPNCLSAIQYAVDILRVRHIIVCGHYGCGGVQATVEDRTLGLSDQWLRHVRDIRDQHREYLAGTDQSLRFDRLCELNVIEQVMNVTRTSIVRDVWSRHQELSIHGWIYAIGNGLLRDLGISISGPEETSQKYKDAISSVMSAPRE